VLLFGIATAIDVFQDRLQQSTIQCLEAKSFRAVQSQELLERIFAATIVGSSVPFRIGPDLISAILKRPKENIQSPNEFIDAFQASLFVLLDIHLTAYTVCLHVSLLFKSFECIS
jgi:origin recognition complex subunit 3